MSTAYEAILSYVAELEIIDTHEHLPAFEEQRDPTLDGLQEYVMDYFNRDLASAGMPPTDVHRLKTEVMPLAERWRLVAPYWELARYTGYGRALDLTARGLYGLDGVREGTIEALDAAVRGSRHTGHYAYVLRNKSHIVTSLLNGTRPSDPRYFRNVVDMWPFVCPETLDDVRAIEAETGVRICAFEDWLAACEISLDRALAEGCVALKNSLAYLRPLSFARVPRYKAEEEFTHLWDTRHFPDWKSAPVHFGRDLQDYMQHYILRLANQRGLTYQIHTGLQNGTGNLIANSNPELLSNLFLQYPDVRFDLFHIGYPYEHVLSALAKNLANVYIDMCWAHIISPQASVAAMVEWIDSVPLNKISAFGGDYSFVDAVYGHQLLARENVSRALAIKVDQGLFDIDRACEIAHLWFYDNPVRIFALEGKL
ncbi:MAG: amidohydrolase family protein [Anaerolineales bacterium]